ncbi:hypothetical protein J6590_090464 [Homalodisca vitripennis]|nr:hypothetical protein J6590_090464 [Homalodisca vitripennis]
MLEFLMAFQQDADETGGEESRAVRQKKADEESVNEAMSRVSTLGRLSPTRLP